MDNSGKPAIGIIGAGRLGCSLALSLKYKGLKIGGVFSRSNTSFEYLTGLLGNHNMTNTIEACVTDSDIIFITASDDGISNVAGRIADCFPDEISQGLFAQKCFLHCSGACDSSLLQELKKYGAATGSLHPLQTFADRDNSWHNLYSIYFGFEGDDKALEAAENITGILDGKLILLNSMSKPVYHAAACFLSNYTVVLSYICDFMSKKVGAEGIKPYFPLLKSTVDNIIEKGSLNALTGPVSRGDAEVVAKHLKAIKKLSEGELINAGFYDTIAELYRSAAEIGLIMAKERGSLADNRKREVEAVLENSRHKLI